MTQQGREQARQPGPDGSQDTADGPPAAVLRGDLTLHQISTLPPEIGQAARLDLAGLERLDTAGAWYLAGRSAQGVELTGLSDAHRHLIELVTKAIPVPDTPLPATPLWRRFLGTMGAQVSDAAGYLIALTGMLGRFLAALGRSLRRPSEFRLTSLVFHCQETGVKAIPIVALMSLLIAVVIAFQGATLLTQFGAEIYVVDLIAISILRELGVLLTAIIVAGRTASALTASIGSMKMREEIDAMRTLGMDPDNVLIVPRILALIITLPLLTLIADIAGLAGGAVMAWITLGISPTLFQARMIADTGVWHVAVGLIKAPVFAVIIGCVGCHAGLNVERNAESLGRMTSDAVVRAIFAVIMVDALFSVFFAQVGI
ncbi:MAG: ABC transporter permease [Paracoccus sp. (in: a-proteobacteria)]|nr:ABC transporter permease [Paracoccus sp. (in: a-proteobacteria)]